MVRIEEYKDFSNTNAIVALFTEYITELGIDPSFQDFDTEISNLDKLYSHESGGCLITATKESELVGCVALKKLSTYVCEMKRLFVKPEFRTEKTGVKLVKQVIQVAVSKGYSKMKLDVLQKSHTAIALYHSLGFKEINSYCFNPYPAIWMELDLEQYAIQRK